MSPGTASIISTQSTVTTAPSVSSAKSLKNYEIDENFVTEITKSFDGGNIKDWEFHLVSAPVGFPCAHLQDIPVGSSDPHPIIIHSEGADRSIEYICENSSSSLIVPKILPFPCNNTFSCVNVKSTFCIRKSIQEPDVSKKYFIPRPHPKPMSEGLIERMKPFGWQNPGEKIDILSSPSKKFKKRHMSSKNKVEKKKKRQLADSSPSLLDNDSHSDFDSDETFLPSPPKKKKKLKTVTESPIPKLLALSGNAAKSVIEPFMALNAELSSPKLKKKHKKDKKSRRIDESAEARENRKKSKKKKKDKKLKKEKKKLKKKKRDKVKVKKEYKSEVNGI